jgi:hypothetical protein
MKVVSLSNSLHVCKQSWRKVKFTTTQKSHLWTKAWTCGYVIHQPVFVEAIPNNVLWPYVTVFVTFNLANVITSSD